MTLDYTFVTAVIDGEGKILQGCFSTFKNGRCAENGIDTGKYAIDYVPDEDKDKVINLIEDFIQSQHTKIRPFKCAISYNGSGLKQFEWSLSKLLNNNGDGLIFLCIGKEILEDNEHKYGKIAEEAPALICCFKGDGKLRFTNNAFCRYFSSDSPKNCKYNYFYTIPEEIRNDTIEALKGLTPEYPMLTYEHGVTASNGENRQIRWSVRAIFNGKNRLLEYHSFGSDITEVIKARDALQKSKNKYKHLVSSMNDALFMYKPNGTLATGELVEINTVACKMIGCDKTELMGRQLSDFLENDEDEILTSENFKAFAKCLTDLGCATIECFIKCKNGKKIPVEFCSNLFKYDEEPMVVAVARDISERKRVRQKLLESYKLANKTLDGTIKAFANTLDMRDPYTAGHQRRVAALACAIAEKMGMPKEKIESIRIAGILHDIGKMQIPAEILSKPGKLNDLEFKLVKGHVEAGFHILQPIHFAMPIAEIVMQHHERMDGSGYPKGLTGDEIMPESKVLMVADVIEAMSSHRPYRPALGVEKSLEEITVNRGRLYDEEVVDACLELFGNGEFSFENLSIAS